MSFHPSAVVETVDAARATGVSAGDKAGVQMFEKCAPPGNVNSDNYFMAVVRAHQDAIEQMRRAGTAEDKVVAWSAGFDEAFKRHAVRLGFALGMISDGK